MRDLLRAGSCAVRPADRVVRAGAAVLAATFALTMTAQPWCAVPAGVCSVLLAVGAVTGWCPTDLLRRRREEVATNDLGYADARRTIDPT